MSLTEEQIVANRKDALVGFITAELASYIAEDEGLSVEEALLRLYQTRLGEKLEDYKTGYYLEPSAYLYEIYQEECSSAGS